MNNFSWSPSVDKNSALERMFTSLSLPGTWIYLRTWFLFNAAFYYRIPVRQTLNCIHKSDYENRGEHRIIFEVQL
jgi:hypothetical protein